MRHRLSARAALVLLCAAPSVFGQVAPPVPPQGSPPGPAVPFVDVVSYDNYRELSDRFYHEILMIADGKPIAPGELGGPPSAEVLKAQPRWVWFMTWAGGEERHAERLKNAYGNPYYVNRGDPVPGN